MNDDKLQHQIIVKIRDLTAAGKLEWRDVPATQRVVARISPILVVEFELRAIVTAIEINEGTWDSLTVREGTQTVLRVNNTRNVLQHALMNDEAKSLYELASQIFELAVLKPRRDRMQRALDELNSIN